MNWENIVTLPARMLPVFCIGLTLTFAQHLTAQEKGGTISGTVAIPAAGTQSRHTIERYGGYNTEDTEMKSKAMLPPEVTNVVISLEGPGTSNLHRESRKVVLDQKDATFIPHVLPIPRGTTVEIVNQDKTYHNVFSLSPVKKFNIGRRPTGEEVPVTFDKAGVVPVFCDIHSHMNAYIVVLNTDIFTQPNADGSYELTGISPGTYTLHVWHEHFSTPPQQVVVKAGEVTTANFSLQ